MMKVKIVIFSFAFLAAANIFGMIFGTDFEKASASGWKASGGKLTVINPQHPDKNNKYLLQAVSTKKTMVLHSPWFKKQVRPETNIEFDWRMDNRAPIRYIAFALITDTSKKPIWLKKYLVEDITPGKWHHFSFTIKDFKVKKNCLLKCFAIQIASQNGEEQIFKMDNFSVNNRKIKKNIVQKKTKAIFITNSGKKKVCHYSQSLVALKK
jgi:hypothetical protein